MMGLKKSNAARPTYSAEQRCASPGLNPEALKNMLKLRLIGLSDYSVIEGRQRIGRIRLAEERAPPVWIWSIIVHLPGGAPTGAALDLESAKTRFKEAWESLKARTTPEQLASAFKAMNIRDDC
jgi:hypothetical protein